MNSKLYMSRAQIASFISDPEALRKLERLFEVGDRFEESRYVDLDFPIIIRTAAVGIPTMEIIHGDITAPQWQVDDYYVGETKEVPHGWDQSTPLEWHLHLTTNGVDATERFMKFELQYGYVAPRGQWVWPATITTADISIPANTLDQTMIVMQLGTFTPPASVGAHIVARLKRLTSTGAAPTLNPWIPMLQAHVILDTTGSRTTSAK